MKIDKSLIGKKYLDHHNTECEIIAVRDGIVRVEFYDAWIDDVRRSNLHATGDNNMFEKDIKDWINE